MKAEIAFMAMRRSNMLLESISPMKGRVREWLEENKYTDKAAGYRMGYKIKKVLVTVIDDTDDLT